MHQCPSLSGGISDSRLLQQCFRKLMGLHLFDLCTTTFTAQGSLTSEPARINERGSQILDLKNTSETRDHIVSPAEFPGD